MFTPEERQRVVDDSRNLVRFAKQVRDFAAAYNTKHTAAREDISDSMLATERAIEVNRAPDANERKLPPRVLFDGR